MSDVHCGRESLPKASGLWWQQSCYNFGRPMSEKDQPSRKPKQRRMRGRPPVHQESWAKVSVVLFERQILRLDRYSMDVRRKSGRTMTRAEIIRALIDGFIASGIDLAAHGSESALRDEIAKRCARGGRSRS